MAGLANLAAALQGAGWTVLRDPNAVPPNTDEFVIVELGGGEIDGGAVRWSYDVVFYALPRADPDYDTGDHQDRVIALMAAIDATGLVWIDAVEPTDYAQDTNNREWAVTTITTTGN